MSGGTEGPQRRARLVYVEAVDTNSIDEIETPYDMLKVGARLAEERGTPSATITRTDTGELLTPEGFSDVAFDVAVDAGVSAAARVVEASRWGQPVGADYVAHHWPGAQQQDPEHFGQLMPVCPLPYQSRPGDPWGAAAAPGPSLCDVYDVRMSADGQRLVWLESLPGWFGGYAVWVEERATSTRRMATRLPGITAGFGDMSLSPDGRWLLANNPGQLIDLHTGQAAWVEEGMRAACWYPFAGPSAVLVAMGDADSPSRLDVRDLAALTTSPLPHTGRRIDGLDAAPDGAIAARFHGAPDWTDCVAVSEDQGRTFEPVAPSHGATGWRRRTTRPRWTAKMSPDAARPVQLAPLFEEGLRRKPPARHVTDDEVDTLVRLCLGRAGRAAQRLEEDPDEIALVSEVRAVVEVFAVLDQARLPQAVRELTTRIIGAMAHHDDPALRRTLAEVATMGRLTEQAAAASRLELPRRGTG